ncbi:MAG: IclR family transcriptional regulator [Synergistaceae bacterium]|jgi:DNA-binding IclR family transcriptional regulator|nr:IclR family transcriptional regulator [Synergistaceae bacterium]
MNGIRVLERALDVLAFMAKAGEPVRISDIAGVTNLSHATVYRILSTLRRHNVVLQGKNSLYMIGPAPLTWAGAYHARAALTQAFRAEAMELWRMSRETVHLYSFERDRIYYVDKMDSPQNVIMRSHIGAWRDLYSTAGGRAVLSALPETERTAYLESTPLVAHTDCTCIDREALLRLLADGKQRGYHADVGENEEGICCIGAPVLNASGYPIGAISVSAPAYRMNSAAMERIGWAVRSAAGKITQAMKA